jgi:hypothetical protein
MPNQRVSFPKSGLVVKTLAIEKAVTDSDWRALLCVKDWDRRVTARQKLSRVPETRSRC